MGLCGARGLLARLADRRVGALSERPDGGTMGQRPVRPPIAQAARRLSCIACYGLGLRCWHPVLRRYLRCQTGPGEDPRFEGGLAIYDAPEPWGPWTTVFYTSRWDVGPGESSSLPAKWMSDDGRTVHLVFFWKRLFFGT